MAWSMTAASQALLVIGPTWSKDQHCGRQPRLVTSPYVGLWPRSPHIAVGPRTEPPVSEPRAPAQSPAAAAAPEPDDEPEVIRSTFQGLRPVRNGPSCIEPSVAGRPN